MRNPSREIASYLPCGSALPTTILPIKFPFLQKALEIILLNAVSPLFLSCFAKDNTNESAIGLKSLARPRYIGLTPVGTSKPASRNLVR